MHVPIRIPANHERPAIGWRAHSPNNRAPNGLPAIRYKWTGSRDPFAGSKKLPADDPYENVKPFSVGEQRKLIEALPDYWKPFFKFAFASGLRPGERIAPKPEDIDWENGILHIRRAYTLNEEGKPMEGRTKNRYSRRSIKLLPLMLEALREQERIREGIGSAEYFFCAETGSRIDPHNLRYWIWIPSLKRCGMDYRTIRQTRRRFAANAPGSGRNPLRIAMAVGRRNTGMIIKVYGKYIEDSNGGLDGSKFERPYRADESSDTP